MMKVGIIGVGVVGGVLKKWFEEHTSHSIKCVDPGKGLNDSLKGCHAIFISIPVEPAGTGQDLKALKDCVTMAKEHTPYVFVRSTVLPGTNDSLCSISMPEFLTERTAYEDMCQYPLMVGHGAKDFLPTQQIDYPALLDQLFPQKTRKVFSNVECEMAKFTHNCFGAWKVTYFNFIYRLCSIYGANFDNDKSGASVTGFIEPTHTMVPGPDGKYGFGGKCFPENMQAIENLLWSMQGFFEESLLFRKINQINETYRAGQ
jgi:UDP-glucose 6-dehydrogenase